ncbi:hypothetical protein AVEN_250692-1, partial [Araneus ventricosus]
MSTEDLMKDESQPEDRIIEILPLPRISGSFLTSSQISNSVYAASLAFHGFHILREELGDGNYGKV